MWGVGGAQLGLSLECGGYFAAFVISGIVLIIVEVGRASGPGVCRRCCTGRKQEERRKLRLACLSLSFVRALSVRQVTTSREETLLLQCVFQNHRLPTWPEIVAFQKTIFCSYFAANI